MGARIVRAYDGKFNLRVTESYGIYDCREDAEKVAVELEKHNWDKSKLQEIRENLGVSKAPKYYSPLGLRSGEVHYVVNKTLNGKNVCFGTYRDEDTAKKIVDELRKVDWNKSFLPRIRDKVLVKEDE